MQRASSVALYLPSTPYQSLLLGQLHHLPYPIRHKCPGLQRFAASFSTAAADIAYSSYACKETDCGTWQEPFANAFVDCTMPDFNFNMCN